MIFRCLVVYSVRLPYSPRTPTGRRICSGKTEGLNEQGRSRDHELSDEGDQTRKQHYVAQERACID
jgi:hypothetical protein